MVVEEESRGDACTEYLESDRVILREMFCSADSIDGIPFIEISGLLDRILSTRGIPAKLKLLEELWLHFRSQNAFPVLRLLVPHLDLSRAAFGLKENGIARLYISALGLASNSKDALRLVNFRKPKSVPGTRNFATSAALAAGDFASVVYDVIRSRTRDSQDSKGWNIGQVNEILDQLAKVDCSSEERKKIWNKVVCEISAREQFWLVRIILKDLKIGLRHESLLKHFHPNAYEVFNSSTDLKQVCDYVLDPNSSKDFKGIQLFRPVRSMLAARIELEQIVPSFKGKKFCIEIKFDGERIQIHKLGNSLRFFTRSGKDFTERHNYRKVLQDAIFSSVQADGCIIDGELVVWNRNLQTFESFGMNRPVARAQSMQSGKLEIPSENTESQSDIEDSSVQDFAGKQLCFVAFDILMLDGKSLIEKTLQERKNILFSIIRPVTHVFELAEYYTEAKSTEDILKKLEEANENKLEGIVIKGLDSEYLPGEREKTGWIKLKAEYVEGMTDTVDAIIIGGYYGSGKIRSGDISRFLVAICEKPSSVNQFPTKFYPLCRVGSGYTIEQLREIRRILAPSWKNFDSATCQDLLGDWNPSKEDTPDLLISPSNSIILELMAGGISKVSRKKFNSGFTLRFPRVVSIRLSKPWYECDSLTDLQDLFLQSERLHAKRPAHSVKKTTPNKARKTSSKIYAAASSTEAKSSFEIKSKIFAGLEICVISGSDEFSKADLERLVKEGSGRIVQNPLDSTNFVIIINQSIRAKNIISSNAFTVLDGSWIIDSYMHSTLQPLIPKYIHTMTEKQKIELSKNIDPFGDSYTEDATKPSVQRALDQFRMCKGTALKITDSPGVSLDGSEILNLKSKFSLFRGKSAFVYNFRQVGGIHLGSELCKELFMLYGGTVVDSFTEKLDFVFVPSDPKVQIPTEIERSSSMIFPFSWVKNCISQNRIMLQQISDR